MGHRAHFRVNEPVYSRRVRDKQQRISIRDEEGQINFPKVAGKRIDHAARISCCNWMCSISTLIVVMAAASRTIVSRIPSFQAVRLRAILPSCVRWLSLIVQVEILEPGYALVQSLGLAGARGWLSDLTT